jgi:hypothetical protein
MKRQPQSKKQIPFDFVLEQLERLSPVTKPMFGCTAVYVGEKIVLILRNRNEEPEDNGVWLATTSEHHQSLSEEFPSMRSIAAFGSAATGWQVLPLNQPDFEESVVRACDLILNGDPRIGKVPKPRKLRLPNKLRATNGKRSIETRSRTRPIK